MLVRRSCALILIIIMFMFIIVWCGCDGVAGRAHGLTPRLMVVRGLLMVVVWCWRGDGSGSSDSSSRSSSSSIANSVREGPHCELRFWTNPAN